MMAAKILLLTNDTIYPSFVSTGAITLIANQDLSTVVGPNNVKFFQYRYVIIPSSVPGRLATVDWNNYEAVKKYLNLKD